MREQVPQRRRRLGNLRIVVYVAPGELIQARQLAVETSKLDFCFFLESGKRRVKLPGLILRREYLSLHAVYQFVGAVDSFLEDGNDRELDHGL